MSGDITAPDIPAAPLRATRWSRISARQTAWLAAILVVILAALVVPPFVFLMQGSVTIAGPNMNSSEWGLGNFETVLNNRHFVTTSMNSLVFAAASAALALLIGWVTAWIVERTNTPLKALAYLTSIISLGTPYILYVTRVAVVLRQGRSGQSPLP